VYLAIYLHGTSKCRQFVHSASDLVQNWAKPVQQQCNKQCVLESPCSRLSGAKIKCPGAV
jgi:hypothetical protein